MNNHPVVKIQSSALVIIGTLASVDIQGQDVLIKSTCPNSREFRRITPECGASLIYGKNQDLAETKNQPISDENLCENLRPKTNLANKRKIAKFPRNLSKSAIFLNFWKAKVTHKYGKNREKHTVGVKRCIPGTGRKLRSGKGGRFRASSTRVQFFDTTSRPRLYSYPQTSLDQVKIFKPTSRLEVIILVKISKMLDFKTARRHKLNNFNSNFVKPGPLRCEDQSARLTTTFPMVRISWPGS